LPRRDGQVGLFDATEHFAIELFAKGGDGGSDAVSVGVFRLEIGAHLGTRLLAQPSVFVHTAVAVQLDGVGLAASHGRHKGLDAGRVRHSVSSRVGALEVGRWSWPATGEAQRGTAASGVIV